MFSTKAKEVTYKMGRL